MSNKLSDRAAKCKTSLVMPNPSMGTNILFFAGEAPSTPPTYSPPPPLHVPAPVSELYPKPFVSLNGVQGARKIIQITDCDDCSISIRLERIPIRWFEDTYTYEMTVSSNGQMRPDGCDMWDFECAIIDVAFADLDPSQRGDVWFYDATTEAVDYQKQELGSPAVYIFSWEDVAFFPDPYSYLNAQARFYINGTIEFCWGSANTNGFNVAAGLADARYSVSLPAMGGPFGQTGVTTNGEWPTNLCQSFDVTKTVPSIPEQPSLYPTYEPWWGTTSPSLPPPSSCVSTMGQCADHFEALLRYVSGARKGETIAVCGEINVTSSLQLSMPDVSICCVDGYRCGLNSDGTSRILVVTGSYVRLEGLAFHGGNVTGDDGGNLKIDGPGHHKISQCLFTGGISDQWGGNLYVSNADSIQISESTIEYGNGRYGAGGAVFMDTSVVMVKGSYFEYNEGGREGGAVLVRSSNPFSLINATFVDTFFGFNIAAIGGGLMTDASNLRLFVLDSYFEGNSGYAWGGAAAIMEYSVVLLAGNTGKANTGGDCTDFYITDDWISYTCSEVWEYFWLSDSSAPPPSTMPPVGTFD